MISGPSPSMPYAGPAVLSATIAERQVRRLYADRAQDLFGFGRRLGLADDDASDAVQETMLRLWRELDAGVAIADPNAWAFRTLYRLAMDRHRLTRRVRGLAGRLAVRTSPGRQRNEDPAGRADLDAVWEAVDALPERQRAVVYLRYRADLPFERIGAVMGITPNAARSHAAAAMATLRRRLCEEADE